MIRSVRLVAILLILGICVSFVPAAATAAPALGNAFVLTADEREYLDSIRSKPVIIGTTSDLISFTDRDGNPSGMLLPLLELLENEFGLTVQTVAVEWGDMFEKLDDGTIDMFGLAISSEGRRGKYKATDDLFISGLDVYTRADSPLGSIMNIENKRVACVTNSVLPNIIHEYIKPSTTINYYSKIEDMFIALENGEVDCVFSSLAIQSELIDHPGVEYEMRISSVRAPQCLYSGNPELERLIDIVNRYIRSGSGEKLISDISRSRVESILQIARMSFEMDIRRLRENYEHLRVYDSGVLYPLSYSEDGVYKGFQQDINEVFLQLTGMPIELCPPSDFENGFITAVDMIKSGELVGATSIHLNSAYAQDPDFAFSRPIMSDNLRIYSLTGREKNLLKLKIGTTRNAEPYVEWTAFAEQPPLIFGDRSLLMSALKQREVDAIFIGEMCADYYYTVKKDYTLRQVGDMSVATSYYMMMNTKNKNFNKLFDESVKLQKIIHPNSRENWTNVSREDKFALMRLQSRTNGYQTVIISICILLFMVLSVLLYSLRYQNKKFSTYDKQITMMLTAQKNADMLWGNTETGELVSKGNFPIYRNWDLNNYPGMPPGEAFIAEGFFDEVRDDLREIDEKNLSHNVAERTYHSSADGSDYYLRRYTHRINADEFMVFTLDITDEKQREAVLSELANTDPLSRLKNRRAMQEILSYKASKLAGSGLRLFVMMIDVDDFKNINDSYGHAIGDEVLISLAKTFRNVAPSCVAARWGGEEFLIAAEAKTAVDALEIAERIREDISGKVFHVGTRATFSVTISCGVSELLPDSDIKKVISQADSAMYDAKKCGKNCVRTDFQQV